MLDKVEGIGRRRTCPILARWTDVVKEITQPGLSELRAGGAS